jgi:hypothetical protein
MTTLLATLIPSGITVAGTLIVFFRWVGKVDANTKATEKLTEAFGTFSERVNLRVDDLLVRVSILERTK